MQNTKAKASGVIAAILAIAASANAWVIAAIVAAICAIVFVAVVGPLISFVLSFIGQIEGRPLNDQDIKDGIEWRDRHDQHAAVVRPRDAITVAPLVTRELDLADRAYFRK